MKIASLFEIDIALAPVSKMKFKESPLTLHGIV